MSLYLRIYEQISEQPFDRQLGVLNEELKATTDNGERIFILCWMVEKLCTEVTALQKRLNDLT
jgi:hypothetical protein